MLPGKEQYILFKKKRKKKKSNSQKFHGGILNVFEAQQKTKRLHTTITITPIKIRIQRSAGAITSGLDRSGTAHRHWNRSKFCSSKPATIRNLNHNSLLLFASLASLQFPVLPPITSRRRSGPGSALSRSRRPGTQNRIAG